MELDFPCGADTFFPAAAEEESNGDFTGLAEIGGEEDLVGGWSGVTSVGSSSGPATDVEREANTRKTKSTTCVREVRG